ncbi:TPA_asm: coat protein [ssRNA phage SRR7976299_2]|uniref:Coat protein n=1 Tax=ssRNA phage SRR7976299_2 TaxID=2786642 RepID=A0A8S5L5S5_9VIRU|nr:coat protein [ssRNA phage SRR7976299_2]DAD52666.1 TPA_asm: coat protein [ssRNA phage SRR7976299_2]
MIVIPAAITGATQTGLTAPIYNTTVDTPPDSNSKQVAVTSLGGTQAGVDAHSVSRPFTQTVSRPKQMSSLGKPNPTTGRIASIPLNTYKVLTRKGVLPIAGQPSVPMIIRTEIQVPAGADTADAPSIRAALSAHIGLLSVASAGVGDTCVNGVI